MTRGSSTACVAAPRRPSPGSTTATPPASTTWPCAWSGTGRTPRTSPRTCSSARSSACRRTARCCCDRGSTGSRSNRCYDYLRGTSRRPLPVAAAADAPSSVDPYEQSELQQLLEASIGDLTRRQRAALLLKDVHGLSLVEVAACLDLTPGSVEVLLARARRAFRASYEVRCDAAGRPLPRSAGGLAALPLLPLPASLLASALPLPLASPGHMPPAHLPPAAVLCPPLTVARRERHQRRARPAGVGQDGRADRRGSGHHGHGRDRRDAVRPAPAAARRQVLRRWPRRRRRSPFRRAG